jgi:hypothetical protein
VVSEQHGATENELPVDLEFFDEDASDTETADDAKGQTLAENEQEQPRSVIQKIGNAIEDLIPGDSDKDGH